MASLYLVSSAFLTVNEFIDPTDFFSGSITVGEVLEDYLDIHNVAKLNITNVPEALADEQHHQILLDADGITGPDGKAIPVITEVEQTENKKQATVVLDCGFTLPQVPRSVSFLESCSLDLLDSPGFSCCLQ